MRRKVYVEGSRPDLRVPFDPKHISKLPKPTISNDEFRAQLRDVGAVICAAGDGLAPADRKLYSMWVHPDHRGTGVATALLDAMTSFSLDDLGSILGRERQDAKSKNPDIGDILDSFGGSGGSGGSGGGLGGMLDGLLGGKRDR